MKHMLSSALFAGFAAGLLCALLQYLLVQPDIVLAERYESGELTHFSAAPEAGHSHDTSAAEPTNAQTTNAQTTQAEAGAEAHDHEQAAEPTPLMRNALTVLFAILTFCGYGLVLIGGINLAEQVGIRIGLAQGILWGLAGFLSFQMMPALGLSPELPGMAAADLSARQSWWAATAVATGAGLWFLCYGSAFWQRVVGAGVLAAPHIWGAPQVAEFAGIVPPELAASFAAHSLGVGLITWAVLGGLLVTIWHSETAR
jgi:cobalt transporter subunit CbtA